MRRKIKKLQKTHELISIIVFCYNEEDVLFETHDRLSKVMNFNKIISC